MFNQVHCPCCLGNSFEPSFKFLSIPISGVYRNKGNNEIKLTSLRFELCTNCAYVRQITKQINKDYIEVTRSTELQFPKYIKNLIEKLNNFGVESNDLIIEIGANDGKFIEALREHGYSNVMGVEPSKDLAKIARKKNIKIFNEYFGNKFAKKFVSIHGKVDVIICRHTLEHVSDVEDFIKGINYLMSDIDSILLIEVPDSDAIIDLMNVYEIWDEHLHYYSESNLLLFLNNHNFRVLETENYSHLDTRNLLMWCEKGNNSKKTIESSLEISLDKVSKWRNLKFSWDEFKYKMKEKINLTKKPIYMIGASHSQTNFINYLEIPFDISFCIDDDPKKTGKVPPTINSDIDIITTNSFLNAKNGTLLKTGFGYPEWSNKLTTYAKSAGFSVIDINLQRKN